MFISEACRQFTVKVSGWLAGSSSAAAAAFFLAAGIVAARLLSETARESWLLVLLPCLATILVILILVRRRKKLFWSALGILFFLLGFHGAASELLRGRGFEPSTDQCFVSATVAKMLGTGPDFRILLVDDGYNETEKRRLPGCGRLFLRNNTIDLTAGDTIGFRSRIRRPVNRGNPGEFDWEGYCRTDDIRWLASVSKNNSVVLIRRAGRWTPWSALFQVREAMRRFLDQSSWTYVRNWVDEGSASDVRAFLKGIILGDRSEIGNEVRENFSNSGLAHTLSASGVHLAIVVLLTMMSVKTAARAVPEVFLWLPLAKITALASIPAMVIYCLLVGANVPAVRSTIMGLVVALAILADRRWESANSLIVAALLILLVYPLSLFAVDFQLSFLAVAGIFLVLPAAWRRIVEEPAHGPGPSRGENAPGQWERWWATVQRSVVGGTLTCLGATLAVTPLILDIFHSFPVYTLFANLLADSVLTIALFFGLLAAAVGPLCPALGALLLIPADLGSLLVIKIAALFAGLPCSTLKLRHLSSLEWLVSWMFAAALIWSIRRPSKKSLGAVAVSGLCFVLSLAAGPLLAPPWWSLKVVFLNVGRGDAAFVEPRGFNGLLIDGGLCNPYFDCGRSIILPFLVWNGTRRLDGMVLSHPQMDHMGGLLSLVPHMRPAGIWWNPVEPIPRHLERIMEESRKVGTSIIPADRSLTPVKVGETRIRFVNRPCLRDLSLDPQHGVNDAAAVCRVEHGSISFLFTGDMERDGEDELVSARVPLQATVLKVGHHGSRTSTSRQFLEAVRPEVAVISYDHPVSSGLPSREVLDRLRSAGVTTFWTGRDGAVTVETDGKIFLAKTGKGSEKPLSARVQPDAHSHALWGRDEP